MKLHLLPALLAALSSLSLAPSSAWSLTISDRMVETTCSGIGGIAENCYWYYTFDESRCPGGVGAKCDSLVIFFSSGLMKCDITDTQDNDIGELMNMYATDTRLKYVAVAACQYETEDSSPKLPMYQHAERIDNLIAKITSDPNVTGHWTGENLLLSGTSHGAATPLVSMARSTVDENPHWHGSAQTAVCMIDGSVDVEATAVLLKSDPDFAESPTCTDIFDRNVCERYGQPNGCAFEDSKGRDTALDSITHVRPGQFAFSAFKLVSCGETLVPCAGDVATPPTPLKVNLNPGGPLEKLCRNIDSHPSKRCEFGDEPTGHSVCFWTRSGFEQCAEFFHCRVDPFSCLF